MELHSNNSLNSNEDKEKITQLKNLLLKAKDKLDMQ